MGQRLFKPVPRELQIREEISRGSFGTVYRGSLQGRHVAIKQLYPALVNYPALAQEDKDEYTYAMKAFSNECNLLRENRHENLLHFVGLYDSASGAPLLVTELMKESLTEYLKRKRNAIDNSRKVNICLEISKGLAFLHNLDPLVLHRDLTSNNVLIGFADQVKIGDLGQAKLLNLKEKLNIALTTAPGNILYMPPEALVRNPSYCEKLDVFSEGVVFLQVMCERAAPRPLMIGIGTMPEVERRKDDLDELYTDHPMRCIILDCLQDDPQLRPCASDVCSRLADICQDIVAKPQEFRTSMLTDRKCQLYWKKCPDLPVPVRFAKVLVNGFKVYVCGGATSNIADASSMQVFHAVENMWKVIPDAPQICCECVMVRDRVVLIGGQDSRTLNITDKVSTLLEADGIERFSTDHYPRLPQKLFRSGVCYHNGVIVVAGGLVGPTNTLSNSVHVLNLNNEMDDRYTLQWCTIPALRLPYTAHCFSMIVTSERLILVNHYKDQFFLSNRIIYCKWTMFDGVVTRARALPNELATPINEDRKDIHHSPGSMWTEGNNSLPFRSTLVTNCYSRSAVILGGTTNGSDILRAINVSDLSRSSQPCAHVCDVPLEDLQKVHFSAACLSPTSFIILGGHSDPVNWKTSLSSQVFLAHM